MASITRTSQSARARRREQMRDRLGAAVEAMMAGGESYTELSVERIVTEGGISRATFYVYFEDKSDLLRALAEGFIERILEAASVWWNLPPSATKADLREALGGILEAYVPHKLVMAAVVEVASYDTRLQELFGGLIERTSAEVCKHIKRGQRGGYIATDLDARRTAAWLTWMAERGLYQLVAPASGAAHERLLDALCDITWNTLYAGAL